MGIYYFEIHLRKQAALIKRIWGELGKITMKPISHMEHFAVLNPGLANEMLQVGDSGDWDHFENTQGSQDPGQGSGVSLLFSSHSYQVWWDTPVHLNEPWLCW